jgi:hypothetical protein
MRVHIVAGYSHSHLSLLLQTQGAVVSDRRLVLVPESPSRHSLVLPDRLGRGVYPDLDNTEATIS